MRRPRMSAWRNSVTGLVWPARAERHAPRAGFAYSPLLPGAAGLPLRDDLVGGGRLLRQHDLRDAALPLPDEELTLRSADFVPAQRAEDRVDLVVAKPVGELLLPISVD